MSSSFYKDLMENNSDVSEIGPEDLENIVKGVDDIDDALFGFKPKQQDSQKNVIPTSDVIMPERPKSAVKKQLNDFPPEDPLADISLSDDDFFDLAKKSPSATLKRDITAPKTPSKDKLTKSKKIANLFGLDDEDDVVTDNKKKQESAADWLGIKESPVKTPSKPILGESFGIQTSKTETPSSLTAQEPPKTPNLDVNPRPSKNVSKEIGIPLVKKSEGEIKTQENQKTKSVKGDESIFGLLEENQQFKGVENIKEKKSAIFDELFGDSPLIQKNKSRRNSAVKPADMLNIESQANIENLPKDGKDDSLSALGQYIPSATASKRPTLGRRREPTSPVKQQSVTAFQNDWLLSPDSKPQAKKETSKSKIESTKSAVEVHDGLPTWLGGPSITPSKSIDPKQSTKHDEEKQKITPAKLENSQTIDKTKQIEQPLEKDIDPADQVVDSFKEALATSSEQSHQTTLALQRTEAQLLTALQLQTTQGNLTAVCARQRSLLDNQERQLSQLVARQTDRQSQLEKQLSAQQLRIQQLLQVLAENVTATSPQIDILQQTIPTRDLDSEENSQKKETVVKDLEREIHKANFENEELRLRMELMEKHYKMEYESLQVQHRREIESWEEKLAIQKDLTNQMCEDYKERIVRLKESQVELQAHHDQRIQRLREEKTEDTKQLMEFHRVTLEQMMAISQLVAPAVREEQKQTAFQVWKPLDPTQLTEKEEEILRKENMLKALQEKLEAKKSALEKKSEELDEKEEQDRLKYEELSRQLKREKNQLKYQQQQFDKEKTHTEQQNYELRKQLEDMQERILAEQSSLASEKLKLMEEKAKLDALAKLQGVSGSATFDVLQSKAEVHGALEAARDAELQVVEERRKLREKERLLDTERWRVKEMEEDLTARAEHLDRLTQLSEANQQQGQQALEEAKLLEKRAEEKLQEVERRKTELREKEKNLMKIKLDIAQEEIRLSRKREQLEHILPSLSNEEATTLQPIKNVIDPKMLIMRLRAEREFEVRSNTQTSEKETTIP
ncbi:trichohyalin-like [Macrosteles quadrilineatus]|uniref:trichohyalin-like n=1 Tax=Macrosteles quadrilineatus TaxID=74068 RepID=UPI0023E2374B|nr:trichohyalin-like [Macrosteles quadrilineatus]